MRNKDWLIVGLIALGGVVTSSTMLYLYRDSEFHTYYHGSANVGHDTKWGATVNGDVSYYIYCSDPAPLIHSETGDIYITGRAGSADDCLYVYEGFLGIAVTGWGNVEELVTKRTDNSLTISNGGWLVPGAYGEAVDFNIEAKSLSEAMPIMANILMEVNSATSTPMTTAGIREILIASTDGWKEVDGKKYGRIINVERAITYAVNGIPKPTPVPCDSCWWIPAAILTPLLLQ